MAMKFLTTTSRILFPALVGLVLAACAQSPSSISTTAPPELMVAADPSLSPAPTTGQSVYSSPAEATKALLAAAEAKDQTALHSIFGSGVDELLSGDATQDSVERANFAKEL